VRDDIAGGDDHRDCEQQPDGLSGDYSSTPGDQVATNRDQAETAAEALDQLREAAIAHCAGRSEDERRDRRLACATVGRGA
jgi:hypothetical protein